MTDRRTDLADVDRAVQALAVRLDGLRSLAGAEHDDDRTGRGLAAALLELAAAEQELREARDRLAAQRTRAPDPAADRERKLLRTLVSELPVPVFLLERDGIVRRANRAACELVDVPAAYPVGKPFSVFVSLRDRGALRYAASTTAAGAAGPAVRGSLLARGRDRDVILWLAPVRAQGEDEALVALVALPTGPGASSGMARVAADGAGARAPVGGRAGCPVEVGRAGGAVRGADDGAAGAAARSAGGAGGGAGGLNGSGAGGGAGGLDGSGAGGVNGSAVEVAGQAADPIRRLDTMAAMTRLLLEPGAADRRLERAAELLRGQLADWVLVDLADAAGLVRHLVTGPDAGVAERIGSPVGSRTLPGRVAAARRPELAVRIEHADLGRLPGEGSVAGTLGATSAVCAPLVTPGAPGRLLGTVTLVRGGGAPFELAELGLLHQLCEHLALALDADRVSRSAGAVPDQPPQLPPTGPPLPGPPAPRLPAEPSAEPSAGRPALVLPGAAQAPVVAGLRVAAVVRPAERPGAGAGLCEAVPVGDGLAVLVGDVSGEGGDAVAAAVAHAARVLVHTERRPEKALAGINAYLRAQPDADRFVTAVLARFARRRGGWRVALAGAGHPPALLLPASGDAQQLVTGGRPLGLFEDVQAVATTVDLGPGDTLLLHSEGLTAVRAPDGTPFGAAALIATARAALAPAATGTRDSGDDDVPGDADRVVGAVRDAVLTHTRAHLRDGVTLLAVSVDR